MAWINIRQRNIPYREISRPLPLDRLHCLRALCCASGTNLPAR